MPMSTPWCLCCQYSCPHSELQPLPTFPGDPLRQEARSGPGSYAITVLPLGPDVNKGSLQEGNFCFLQYSGFLVMKPHQSSKPNDLRAPRDARTLCGAQYSHLYDIIIFRLMAHPPEDMGCDYILNIMSLLQCYFGFFFVLGGKCIFYIFQSFFFFLLMQFVVIWMFS